MELTEEQIVFIANLGSRYYMRMTDGWRCDFCEPHCTCDDDYIDGLINDYVDEFHSTDNLHKVRDMIIDY